MNVLLDTNVVSEWVKPSPHPGVIAWLSNVDEDRVFLSVVTLAELRYGTAKLAAGRRRDRLEAWLRDELPLRFEGRIVTIDGAIAEAWGDIVAQSEREGRRMSTMDAFIAATARVHAFTLITRNVADFAKSVPQILNPWEEA